jgi:hypothetical protein
MNGSVKASASVGWEAKLTVRRFIVAVILGEAIWSLLLAITNNLAVPALARVMGGDVQSPLYLGRPDYNIPALLISFLQACLAGIAAVLVNSWPQSRGARPKAVRVAPVTVDRTPVLAPSIVSPSAPKTAIPVEAPASNPPAPPKPAQSVAQPTPPAKPKQPKKVYYNIVGEPVEDDE